MSDFCGLKQLLFVNPVQHLRIWLTPERRKLINASGLDKAIGLELPRFSRFLNGQKHMTLERAGVEEYYPVLRLLGYSPELDLDQDESVQRHRAGLAPFAHLKKK